VGQRLHRCQYCRVWIAEPGAYALEDWRGTPVPPGVVLAVSKLACELYKACVKDDSCALPARVKTVEREGLTYDMIDPMEFIGQGRTGLTEVDMWVSSVNPHGLRSASTVVSPDMYKVRPEGVRVGGFGS